MDLSSPFCLVHLLWMFVFFLDLVSVSVGRQERDSRHGDPGLEHLQLSGYEAYYAAFDRHVLRVVSGEKFLSAQEGWELFKRYRVNSFFFFFWLLYSRLVFRVATVRRVY